MGRVLTAEEVARYDHVPLAARRRAVLRVVPVLGPGTAGMTLGRHVLLRRGREGDRALVAHELVHVRQWAEDGAVRFLLRYLGAYLRNLVLLHDHRLAYLAIPAEHEARAETRAWAAAHADWR